MTKTFKIIAIIGAVFLLFQLFMYFINLYREKGVFGNRSKSQFIKLITEAWEKEYKNAMRNWIRLDNPNEEARNWAIAVQSKGNTNGNTFEKQREITIMYLWSNNMDGGVYIPGSTKWNNKWAIDFSKSLGADTQSSKVIEALTLIHK